MNIAYISYEYPPETALGGIGTYVYQAAHIMKERGHVVEVFAGAFGSSGSREKEGILTHRINVEKREEFAEAILPVFTQRNKILAFDIIEGPEYKAEAHCIAKVHSEIPYVVKLHTPSFLLKKLYLGNVSVVEKGRFVLGSILKGKFYKPYWSYNYQDDLEYISTVYADGICSPSSDLKKIVSREWDIPPSEIYHLPNPFIPSHSFLSIPVKHKKDAHFRITFVGRLEKRKGVLDILKAIPQVLESYAEATFTFVGDSNPSPDPSLLMGEYLARELDIYKDRVQLLGKLPYEDIAEVLAHSDICIFPSLWENFPNVCLEAMSAGRAIIGSEAGGMADMITHEEDGLLVPSGNTKALTQAILHLIRNAHLIKRYGEKARERILKDYSADVIGKLTEDYYHRVIEERSIIVTQPAWPCLPSV